MIISAILLSGIIFIFLPSDLISRERPESNIVKEIFLNFPKNISYTYDCVMDMPHKKERRAQGVLAVNDKGYVYDSSNVRTLFRNKDWYLDFDHENKRALAVYIPNLKEKLEKLNYVNNGDLFGINKLAFTKYDIKRENNEDGTYWLNLIPKDSLQFKNIRLLLDTKDALKAFQGEVNISNIMRQSDFELYDAFMNEDPSYVPMLKFHCYDLKPVNEDVFRDENFIEKKGKRAISKRYKNYKAMLSK